MKEETWKLIRELANEWVVKIYPENEIDVYGVTLKENDDGTLEAIYTIETEFGVYEEETTKILPTVDEVELIIRRTTNSEY